MAPHVGLYDGRMARDRVETALGDLDAVVEAYMGRHPEELAGEG